MTTRSTKVPASPAIARRAMTALWLCAALILAALVSSATASRAEDMAAAISQYRQAHGLSAVKTDPRLTAIAERQAKAMAAAGVMDHSVAGSFSSRISDAQTGMAAENIAAGTKTWAETFRAWQTSRGHNANLLMARADSVGVAVARNEQTQYKTYWAMVIAEKRTKQKAGSGGLDHGIRNRPGVIWGTDDAIGTVRSIVCKVFC